VGSPDRGLHEGVPNQWRTHEYGNLHVCKKKTTLFFSFLHSFLLVFNFFFLICPFPPRVFEFSWSVPSENLSLGTWERRNIAGSPPPHNSLGIFCWWRSLKIQREIKGEVFSELAKSMKSFMKNACVSPLPPSTQQLAHNYEVLSWIILPLPYTV